MQGRWVGDGPQLRKNPPMLRCHIDFFFLFKVGFAPKVILDIEHQTGNNGLPNGLTA
jgi:hypothetical protein